MYVCVCMYVCVYIHIYLSLSLYIYVCIHIYIYIYIYIYIGCPQYWNNCMLRTETKFHARARCDAFAQWNMCVKQGPPRSQTHRVCLRLRHASSASGVSPRHASSAPACLASRFLRLRSRGKRTAQIAAREAPAGGAGPRRSWPAATRATGRPNSSEPRGLGGCSPPQGLPEGTKSCHFRKRASSVPAEGPAYGLDFARPCEFLKFHSELCRRRSGLFSEGVGAGCCAYAHTGYARARGERLSKRASLWQTGQLRRASSHVWLERVLP